MENTEELLAVKTTAGAFSSERAVTVELADGQNVSLFADKALVQQRSNSEFLKVVVMKCDAQAKTKTVLLPSEAFETMSRWVTVSQEKIVPA
jgi:hypothetical protein